MLKFNKLEHVLIENVCQLFRNMLYLGYDAFGSGSHQLIALRSASATPPSMRIRFAIQHYQNVTYRGHLGGDRPCRMIFG
jgi:hypothetical protein